MKYRQLHLKRIRKIFFITITAIISGIIFLSCGGDDTKSAKRFMVYSNTPLEDTCSYILTDNGKSKHHFFSVADLNEDNWYEYKKKLSSPSYVKVNVSGDDTSKKQIIYVDIYSDDEIVASDEGVSDWDEDNAQWEPPSFSVEYDFDSSDDDS